MQFSYLMLEKVKIGSSHLGLIDQMKLVYQLTGVLSIEVNRIVCS